jgi:hypothetical protein
MQQSTRNRALSSNAWTDLEDLQHVIDSVVKAHLETCEFTRERVKEMKMKAKETCIYTEPSRVSTTWCFEIGRQKIFIYISKFLYIL